mmetsp:Transcript_6909/g.15085  ORF Transcript_6909/g.15085 Transcript_6909/m.15085 type:complete len:329 (-) Transcript_6909:177-1163(-)
MMALISSAVIPLTSSPSMAIMRSPGLILSARPEERRTAETTVPFDSILSARVIPSFPGGTTTVVISVVFGAASTSIRDSTGIHSDAPSSIECSSSFCSGSTLASLMLREALVILTLTGLPFGSKMSSSPLTVRTSNCPDTALIEQPIPTLSFGATAVLEACAGCRYVVPIHATSPPRSCSALKPIDVLVPPAAVAEYERLSLVLLLLKAADLPIIPVDAPPTFCGEDCFSCSPFRTHVSSFLPAVLGDILTLDRISIPSTTVESAPFHLLGRSRFLPLNRPPPFRASLLGPRPLDTISFISRARLSTCPNDLKPTSSTAAFSAFLKTA